ncbi:hypothetical protein M514_20945, partial [Trichuris suis]
INADPEFKASQGWLGNFKKCHGRRAYDVHGEKLLADQCSSNGFREELKNFLIEGGYEDDFIYNADETGLNWKALSIKSLIARWEECAPGCKRRKERVTMMLCANSSGTHRLLLFLVGKSKNPRSFKNVKLPVRYSHQKQAWMNFHIFKEWFKGTFIPEAKKYQSSAGKTGEVLLLIDNAPAHPSVEYLDAVDEFVTVKFLPPNVTPLIQPMDQGVIMVGMRYWGFQIMNDEEIIEFISKQPADTEEEDKQGDEKESEQTAFPSHCEAFGYLEGALRWYERQDECDPRRFVSEKHPRPCSCETPNCFEANTDDRFSAKSLHTSANALCPRSLCEADCRAERPSAEAEIPQGVVHNKGGLAYTGTWLDGWIAANRTAILIIYSRGNDYAGTRFCCKELDITEATSANANISIA